MRAFAIGAALAVGVVIILAGTASATWFFPKTIDTISTSHGTASGGVGNLRTVDGNVVSLTETTSSSPGGRLWGLVPDSDNGSAGWSENCGIGGFHLCIDDDPLFTPDENTTIAWSVTAPSNFTVGLAPYLGIPAETIESVMVDVRARKNGSSPSTLSVNLRDPVAGKDCSPFDVAGLTQAFAVYSSAAMYNCGGEAWTKTVLDRLELTLGMDAAFMNATITAARLSVTTSYTTYNYLGYFQGPIQPGQVPISVNWTCARVSTTNTMDIYAWTGAAWLLVSAATCLTGNMTTTNASLPGGMPSSGAMQFRLSSSGGTFTAGSFRFDRFVFGVNYTAPPGSPDLSDTLNRIWLPIVFFVILIGIVILAYVFRKRHGGI